MGSPITFSGFNKIDFGLILDAVMEQEQAPLRTLQAQQKELESRAATYRTLASKIATFETAVNALSGKNALSGRKGTNTNETLVNASVSDSAAAGIYDVVVQELARAQVTASTTFPPDADQTIVASSGAIVIGGVTVNIDAPVTLQGLADRINGTADIPVTATVVRAAPNSWQLVLTGRATGVARAFTVSSSLSGADPGGAIAFGGNAVEATDARVLINNVTVTSDTNTVSDAILGVTLQLLKRDPDNAATISVGDNLDGSKQAIKNLVSAFNDLVKFTEDQNLAASKGDGSSIARDPLLRGLRGELREKLTAEYIAGGAYASLAAVGFEFDRTGRISFKESVFDAAVQDNRANVTALFGADGIDKGVFQSLKNVLAMYTNADGLLKDMNDRIDDQTSAIARRIGDLEDRLAIRRQVLQQEFVAADMLMTQLNSQVNALSSLGSQYSLF